MLMKIKIKIKISLVEKIKEVGMQWPIAVPLTSLLDESGNQPDILRMHLTGEATAAVG